MEEGWKHPLFVCVGVSLGNAVVDEEAQHDAELLTCRVLKGQEPTDLFRSYLYRVLADRLSVINCESLTSVMYIGGMTVVAPMPIPLMNLDAYMLERLPPFRPWPRTPAMYMTVATSRASRRPYRSVMVRH